VKELGAELPRAAQERPRARLTLAAPALRREGGAVRGLAGAPEPELLVVVLPVARARLKRTLDVVLAAAALVLAAPAMLLIALAVRLDSPGPVLFRQRRIGYLGREFTVRKYRTMVADADAQRAALLALSRDPNWLDLERDPRITRVGRLLRLSSLDELPQLWNVLRGEMSLVGPRPLIPEEHARLPAWARRRVTVPPGVTGLWQVSGRTSISFEDMLRLDCAYIRTWSFAGDLAILLRTVPAVLSRRGAN
jgi:lipopolysaccharide/colanic/teichoic acid biosynthesis glycosyltransferase